jgi:hypothetical protein
MPEEVERTAKKQKQGQKGYTGFEICVVERSVRA